jgi:hypothetical protein
VKRVLREKWAAVDPKAKMVGLDCPGHLGPRECKDCLEQQVHEMEYSKNERKEIEFEDEN